MCVAKDFFQQSHFHSTVVGSVFIFYKNVSSLSSASLSLCFPRYIHTLVLSFNCILGRPFGFFRSHSIQIVFWYKLISTWFHSHQCPHHCCSFLYFFFSYNYSSQIFNSRCCYCQSELVCHPLNFCHV